MLYHKNKGNPLEKCKKICDVIIFAMLETISDWCWGKAADRLLLKSFFFILNKVRLDEMVAWILLAIKDISPNFLTFELGSELTRCGGEAEKKNNWTPEKGRCTFSSGFSESDKSTFSSPA